MTSSSIDPSSSRSQEHVFAHIVAATEDRVIAQNGKLPWHFPEDLQYFKQMTMGKILIMGMTTFKTLKAPLPHRFTFVLSRKQSPQKQENFQIVNSLEELLATLGNLPEEHPSWSEALQQEIMICGGEQIYLLTESLIDKIYWTVIPGKVTGDRFYSVALENFKLARSISLTAPDLKETAAAGAAPMLTVRKYLRKM